MIAASFLISCSDHTSDLNEVNEQALSSGSLEEGNSSSDMDASDAEMDSAQAPKRAVVPAKMNIISASSKKIPIGEKMKVVLDYDFYIGEHEVTCGEYGDTTCGNDSLPVVNVTFYDAVLHANKRSKKEKLDTAYTYKKAIFDSQNHCTQLEEFTFNNLSEGYRLPTEAEWIRTASKGWDADNSWNSGNSDNKPHPVCSKGSDDAGFCDFAGNVMEWVNDWFTEATDTTLMNFIGGSAANGLGERVLKGGSFTNDVQAINLRSRSDVYTVTSSTNTDYVGFRLALGKIPNPTTIGAKTNSKGDPIISLSNADAIKAVTGTFASKLVFRNDVSGNLVYIDYSDVTQPVFEIEDTLNSYHPEISPNGEWVAFCTSIEGISAKSSLYVRKLDSAGTRLTKLNVESASIPRWMVKENGDTVIVYVSDAGNNKDEAEWKQKSTWEVPFANGAFGNPKKIFDGSYHGGIDEENGLAITGARQLRVKIAPKGGSIYDENAKDTIWYNGEQACNASLVKDGTGRTAFLDFGGKTGKSFVGESYSTHQRVFIVDKKGNLEKSIKAWPSHSFDHTEWVSNGEKSNIIGTQINTEGEHQFIVLINVKDSVVIPIVQGEELWHPCLWVAPANKISVVSDTTEVIKLDPDSAGIYFKPNSVGTEYAVKWRYKMELLWKYKDSINTIIMGSSRALHGVVPKELSDNFPSVNFANSSNTLYCTKFFLENYAFHHIKNLKYIVTSIDIDRGFTSSENSFLVMDRKNYAGYVYDENHDFWKDGAPTELAQYTYESFGYYKYTSFRETLGYERLEPHNWGEPTFWKDSTWLNSLTVYYYTNFNVLQEILMEALTRNIKVIGVIFPQNPAYKNTGAFGYHGLLRSQAPALIEEIANLSNIYPNFILVDENKMGDHEYTDDMAFDNDHLADKGAIHFTHKLDSLLKELEFSK